MALKQTKITVTASVAHGIKQNLNFSIEVQNCLKKFLSKDWGKCSENDKKANDADLASAMGSYDIAHGSEKTLWIKRDDHGEFFVITALYPSEW